MAKNKRVPGEKRVNSPVEQASLDQLKGWGWVPETFQANLNFLSQFDEDFRACLPALIKVRRQSVGVICRSLMREALAQCPDLPADLRKKYFA